MDRAIPVIGVGGIVFLIKPPLGYADQDCTKARIRRLTGSGKAHGCKLSSFARSIGHRGFFGVTIYRAHEKGTPYVFCPTAAELIR
jgi:hypothetical protein